jgi:hypothetical protein
MNDHQYGVGGAFSDRASGPEGNFKTLVRAIERSGITDAGVIVGTGTDRNSLSDDRFVNSIAHRMLGELRRPAAFAPATSLTSWAPRGAGTDVDTEILNWIVSHVPSRKRSKAH